MTATPGLLAPQTVGDGNGGTFPAVFWSPDTSAGTPSRQPATFIMPQSYGSDWQTVTIANAAAHVAGKTVGASPAAIVFPNMGPAGARITINLSRFGLDVATLPVGIGTHRLHVYSVTPPSALADNVAWDEPSGDRAGYSGYIDLGPMVQNGASSCYVQTPQSLQVKLAAGDTQLYGYLVTNATTWTPAAATVMRLDLQSTAS